MRSANQSRRLEPPTRANSAGPGTGAAVHAVPVSPRIEIVRGIPEISRFRDAWGRLLSRTPHASFFQSFDWLEVRWRFLRENDADPRVVAVYDKGGALAGLVPLMVQRKATPFGWVRKLRFPVDNWASFYGPVGPRPMETLRSAADFLLSAGARGERDFDVLEFTNLPGLEEFSDAGASKVTECSHVAMLCLSEFGSWEDYWESRRAQKNRRRNVERCERRLRDLGEVGYLRHRPEPGGDPRWDLYEACEELAARSWQKGLEDGNTLHHSEVRPFFRESYRAAVAAGAADLNLLTLDGSPVAFVYGYHFQGYVDLVRVGFDPRHARLAPGNALWTRLIRDSFERGDRLLDFGPSCLDYKRFWWSEVETSYQMVRYAPSAIAGAFRLARWLKEALPLSFASADHTNQESKERAASGR